MSLDFFGDSLISGAKYVDANCFIFGYTFIVAFLLYYLVCISDLGRGRFLFSEFEVCLIYDFYDSESLPDVPVVPFLFCDSLDSVRICVIRFFLISCFLEDEFY